MSSAARGAAILGTIMILGSPALAEGEPGSPTAVAAVPAGPSTCAERASVYAVDKGPRIWVTRQGAMEQENPLRPLTRDHLVVLQVVVNGRLATAWGPDYDNLRQGGPPQALEREAAGPIAWATGMSGLPDAIRIVATDGTVLFGPMRFAECAEAPAAKVVMPAPAKPERKAGAARSGKPGEASREPARLPQGALPGLSLPQGAVN